jgi:hypothetical protein
MIVQGLFCHDTGKQLVLSKKIAVIGNAGSLLNSSYGNFIDKHETVVRFNNANISDYTDSTGKKTTDLVINCHVYWNSDLKGEGFSEWESSSEVFDKHKGISVLYVNTNYADKGRGPIPKDMPFYIMKKEYFDNCQNSPYNLPKIPTVGFATICCLVKSGFKPNIFGFTADKNSKWDHYFEDRPKPSISHSHESEIECLLDMEKRELIKIYR